MLKSKPEDALVLLVKFVKSASSAHTARTAPNSCTVCITCTANGTALTPCTARIAHC